MRVATLTSIGAPAPPAPAPARARGGALVAAVLLIVLLAAAMSVDVVKTGYGVKSDEATYVAMALSLAYDHDLSYERRDLERYFGLYRYGPDGIFLKRGKQLRLRFQASPPFVRLIKSPDPRTDRLFFGKALLYPLVAAPFVRLLGLNGLLVFHVLLLFGVCVCGYTFLAARSRPGPALVFALAFVGASCVPVYAVFLAPEIFNFSLVFFAYFLWLYKEARRSAGGGSCAARERYRRRDLIGAATSKPSHALLIVPIVLWAWWRRRWVSGVVLAAAFTLTAGGLYAVNAINSGEFNYQGGDAGDRKRFVGVFPFDGGPRNAWDDPVASADMTTNDLDTENVLQVFTNRFTHNVEYFLIGRHFGFVPYFFPGVVAIGLWLASRERWRVWRVFTFLAVVGSALALLVLAPYTWSGGGGPPGNRYFMSVYAAIFFLTPPLASAAPALLAWLGGGLFTAKMVLNPFVAAKFPNQTTEHGRAAASGRNHDGERPADHARGAARAFLVQRCAHGSRRARISAGEGGRGGQPGIWVAGDGRADIVMRSDWPIDHLQMTVRSPVPTVFIVSAGGRQMKVPLEPRKPATFDSRHPVARFTELRLPAERPVHGGVHRAFARSRQRRPQPGRVDAVPAIPLANEGVCR